MINVLIADDDVRKTVQISNAITTDEIRCVEIVNEGNKVNERLEKLKPEVLILDLKMPGKDGLEILEDIQKGKVYKPKVFIYSGEEGYMAKAREYKFVDRYYSKLVPPEQIVKDIRESFEEISCKSAGEKANKILFELGFKYHLKGTRLINECIVHSVIRNESNVKNIYKYIAFCEGQNPYTIKSDINKAIKIMWKNSDNKEKIRKILRLGDYEEPSAKGIISMAKYYIEA